jgi:hypothetical protein
MDNSPMQLSIASLPFLSFFLYICTNRKRKWDVAPDDAPIHQKVKVDDPASTLDPRDLAELAASKINALLGKKPASSSSSGSSTPASVAAAAAVAALPKPVAAVIGVSIEYYMTCGAFHSTKLSTFAFRKPNSSKTLR